MFRLSGVRDRCPFLSHHPFSIPFSDSFSLPRASSSSLVHLYMCLPSILVYICSHPGSLWPLPNPSMLVDTSCLKGTCSPRRVTLPQVLFHWVFMHTKGVWQIQLTVFIPSWGETVYRSSVIPSTYVFSCLSASIPFCLPPLGCGLPQLPSLADSR